MPTGATLAEILQTGTAGLLLAAVIWLGKVAVSLWATIRQERKEAQEREDSIAARLEDRNTHNTNQFVACVEKWRDMQASFTEKALLSEQQHTEALRDLTRSIEAQTVSMTERAEVEQRQQEILSKLANFPIRHIGTEEKQ